METSIDGLGNCSLWCIRVGFPTIELNEFDACCIGKGNKNKIKILFLREILSET
jgi:hypothetical protein